jgi:hypothetical protein
LGEEDTRQAESITVPKALWSELLMNYRESLATTENLRLGVESVINRVRLFRMDDCDALYRLEELCDIAASDIGDDQKFVADLKGLSGPHARDEHVEGLAEESALPGHGH